jgi:hypothetical protein
MWHWRGANFSLLFRRHFATPKLIATPPFALASKAEGTKVRKRSGAVLPVARTKHRSRPPRDLWIHREQTMSIFGKIMSAIFGTKAGAAPASGGAATSTGSPAGSATATATAAPAQSVDVAPILDKAVAAKKEKLEWRTSIVDLMKALDIDSSLGARKELAKELGYSGDTNDSATMNVWLHKQVMVKLAANGGKLPADIKW